VQGISDVVAIAAGQFSSYALKADGTLWAWGNDSNGELANGGTADVALPQQVTAAGTKVTAIASGQYASHVLAIEAVAPAEVSPPVISGQAAIGQQLTASTGVWSGTRPLTYSYQWERCRSSCTSIAGATAAAYTLTAADEGKGIRVVVTASNSVGSAVGPSAQTANVPTTPVTPSATAPSSTPSTAPGAASPAPSIAPATGPGGGVAPLPPAGGAVGPARSGGPASRAPGALPGSPGAPPSASGGATGAPTGAAAARRHRGDPRRSAFSAFLERPDNLDLTPASVARSLGIGLLLVVLAPPSPTSRARTEYRLSRGSAVRIATSSKRA